MCYTIRKSQLDFVKETLKAILEIYNQWLPTSSGIPNGFALNFLSYEQIRNLEERALRSTELPIADKQKIIDFNIPNIDQFDRLSQCLQITRNHIAYTRNNINHFKKESVLKTLQSVENYLKKLYSCNLRDVNVENLTLIIESLDHIDIYFPSYDFTYEDIKELRDEIDSLIETIKNKEIDPSIKTHILNRILEIKEILEKYYIHNEVDLEDKCKANIFDMSILNKQTEEHSEEHEVTRKVLNYFLKLLETFKEKITDPAFMSEQTVRSIPSTLIGFLTDAVNNRLSGS